MAAPWKYNDEPAEARSRAEGLLDTLWDDCDTALQELKDWEGASFRESLSEDELPNESACRVDQMARQLLAVAAASPVAAVHGTPEQVFVRHQAAVVEAARLLRTVVDAPDVAAWRKYWAELPT